MAGRRSSRSHLPGVSLLAVGGLGRRDCAPYSDLDLVLLHNGTAGIDRIAAALWYPIWDARLGLDHSVRTLPEALSVAHDDVKVSLGLLDARHLAGDAALSGELIAAAGDQWRRTAVRLMPQLKELTATRWASHGELAFLLEGDLKEAAGGLRDVTILRGIGRAGVADTMRPAVRAADLRLLDTRDALHLAVGRRVDRLVAQERAAVAELLDLDDGDALLRRVAGDARTVAHALDDAWRAADRLRNGRRRGVPGRRAGPPPGRPRRGRAGRRAGARAYRHRPGARPQPVAAGRRGGRHRADCRSPAPPASGSPRSARRCPTPWPPAARAALVSLLGSGPGLLPTWETCDRYGLIDAWLPEWARMRSLPQHHPVHRFTLDRHLVQAAYEATAYAREVDRPDLLLIGAFLHDVGKGLPGDHSIVGAPIAAEIAARIGLPPADVATIEKLVRLHLLLPDVATRRDLERPGDHLDGRRGGRRRRHPRPAARPGPRRLARHRPGRLVGLEGPADGRTGPPRAHRAGHRRTARAARPRPRAAHRRPAGRAPGRRTGSRWPPPTGAGLLGRGGRLPGHAPARRGRPRTRPRSTAGPSSSSPPSPATARRTIRWPSPPTCAGSRPATSR